jgi:hypothetical protein
MSIPRSVDYTLPVERHPVLHLAELVTTLPLVVLEVEVRWRLLVGLAERLSSNEQFNEDNAQCPYLR